MGKLFFYKRFAGNTKMAGLFFGKIAADLHLYVSLVKALKSVKQVKGEIWKTPVYLLGKLSLKHSAFGNSTTGRNIYTHGREILKKIDSCIDLRFYISTIDAERIHPGIQKLLSHFWKSR